MATSHKSRRVRLSANLACEILEKREVLSTASVLSHAWASNLGSFAHSGDKGPGHMHFDHVASSTAGGTGVAAPGWPGDTAPTLPAAVTTAQTKLQTDMKSFQTNPPTKPSDASLAQLQTDLKAVHAGTLTGSAATTTLQNDQNAILTSQGLNPTQIATINSDQAALQAALKTAFPNAPSPPGGIMLGVGFPDGPGGHGHGPGGPGGPGGASLPASVKTVLTQLETDTKAAIGNPPKTPSAASLAQLKTDMTAIKAGTLTGTAATTAIQNDKNAILASQGATTAQIATINADQAAVQTAFKAAFPNAPAAPAGAPVGTLGFNPGGPMIP